MATLILFHCLHHMYVRVQYDDHCHTELSVTVNSFLSQPNCDKNVKDTGGCTALHIAAHEGYPAMVERLVGYGADLNSTSSDGNTALHLTLGRNTMIAPSELSPRILEVHIHLHTHKHT